MVEGQQALSEGRAYACGRRIGSTARGLKKLFQFVKFVIKIPYFQIRIFRLLGTGARHFPTAAGWASTALVIYQNYPVATGWWRLDL